VIPPFSFRHDGQDFFLSSLPSFYTFFLSNLLVASYSIWILSHLVFFFSLWIGYAWIASIPPFF
jgi:hypothetical protein